jgi:hypothetical protein
MPDDLADEEPGPGGKLRARLIREPRKTRLRLNLR